VKMNRSPAARRKPCRPQAPASSEFVPNANQSRAEGAPRTRAKAK
jgi:hypothetical protein